MFDTAWINVHHLTKCKENENCLLVNLESMPNNYVKDVGDLIT